MSTLKVRIRSTGHCATLFLANCETLLYGFERTRLEVVLVAYAIMSSEVKVL
jgi:hypothetical protein